MAIEKKLIHFSRLSDFETQLNAGNILDYSIVFIQDAKKIWTHGQYYDCNGGNSVDLSEYLTADEIAGIYATIESLDGKQDTLVSGLNIKTINRQSLLGSGDITISGDSSSGSSAYSELSHGTADTTFTLTPNTFHIWDEVSALTLTLGAETSGVANEYLFQFTSGSTATTLSLPDDIKWANDDAPVIEANKIYQISILKGLGSVLEWDNAPTLIENKATLNETTISFQYPVASNLTISVGSSTVIIEKGESEIEVAFEPALTINYISPTSDTQYYYTF